LKKSVLKVIPKKYPVVIASIIGNDCLAGRFLQ
jgi:hypothetical protein